MCASIDSIVYVRSQLRKSKRTRDRRPSHGVEYESEYGEQASFSADVSHIHPS